jgi:hypothetical protein
MNKPFAIFSLTPICLLVLMNMKALVAPFNDPIQDVRILLTNCQAIDEDECIVEGTRYYEFFTNDTFIEDKDGLIIRLEDNDIAAQSWSSTKKLTLE